MTNKKFKFKVFTSFALAIAFLLMSVSGIVLYIAPKGRVANWINWTFSGLSKEEWIALHTVFVLVFLVAGIFHLFYFNWKVFWSYLKHRTKKGIKFNREFYTAIGFLVILFIGTLGDIKPVTSIVDLGNEITNSWEVKGSKPPMPHAEEFTIAELSSRLLKINPQLTMIYLERAGYKPVSALQKIKDLAKQYHTSPGEIYNSLKRMVQFDQKSASVRKEKYEPEISG